MTLMRPEVIRFAGDVTAIVRANGVAAHLSCRQLAVLFAVNEAHGSATIRGLSETLSLSKPVVCRALDGLGRLGLIYRRRSKFDKRDRIASITPEAIRFFAGLAALFNTEE